MAILPNQPKALPEIFTEYHSLSRRIGSSADNGNSVKITRRCAACPWPFLAIEKTIFHVIMATDCRNHMFVTRKKRLQHTHIKSCLKE